MDFLLGSLTAGTGGDGMNLGTIENMEVNIPENYAVYKQLFSNCQLYQCKIVEFILFL